MKHERKDDYFFPFFFPPAAAFSGAALDSEAAALGFGFLMSSGANLKVRPHFPQY